MLAFKKRLQDGRHIWYEGQLVENPAEHPAFKGTIETLEKLFLMQHEEQKERLTYLTDQQNRIHLSFLIPKNRSDLEKKQTAYQIWADETFGIMSRLSEYSREILTGWYANRQFLNTIIPKIDEKLERIYLHSSSHDLLSTSAAQDLQKNRSKSAIEMDCGQLRVVNKTMEGVTVRGAKALATAAPYVDEYIISSFHKRHDTQKDLANVFIIPANLPGLQIICRKSFADCDYVNAPLSARYDEMDAVLLFEDVLIPWEYVLVHENPDAAWALQQDPISQGLSQHQTVVRLISKFKSLVAIALGLAQNADTTSFLHIQHNLAGLFMQIETIQALLLAAQRQGGIHNGTFIPKKPYLATARNLGATYYQKGIESIQQIGASGLLQSPATAEELLLNPDWDQYFAASPDNDGVSRIILNKLAWDFIGSPLGSRHELYERFYSGDPVRSYANYYNQHANQQQYMNYARTILEEANI